MKRRTLFFCLALSAIATLSFFSCNKDEHEEDNTPKTKTELLTAANWKYTACVVSPAYDYYGTGSAVTDIFAILKTCEKDDFETYKISGVWEYNEGPTKCDQSSPQLFSDPWSFIANETKLLIGGVEHTIVELTATTLKLRYNFEDSGV